MADNKGALVSKPDNKGTLVPELDFVVQAEQKKTPVANQIGNPDLRLRLPELFTGSIRSVLNFLVLTIARLISPSSGRSCGRGSARRGNGRGRGQGKGRCLKN